MSATPVGFTRLLNLLDYDDIFKQEYIKDFKFTEAGKKLFVNKLTGKISYLNRMKDKRQFAQPVLRSIMVPISEPTDIKQYLDEIKAVENIIEENKKIKITQLRKELTEKCNSLEVAAEKKKCKADVEEQAQAKVAEAKEIINLSKESLKSFKENLKKIKKNDDNIAIYLNKKCLTEKIEST